MNLVNTETGEIVEIALNDLERQRLVKEETSIEAGAAQIGGALAVIRDQRLYRETHPTFEAYCHERWGITNRYANYQINATQVGEVVGTMVPERQARELAPLLDAPQVLLLVWEDALKASGGKLTAEIIRECRERFLDDVADEVADEAERQTGVRPQFRRSPLPDAYSRRLHDLTRKADALVRLTQDDRYSANRAVVTGRHGSDALRALLTIGAAVAQLDPATLAANEKARQWWLTSLNEITEVLQDFGQTLKENPNE